MREIPNVLLKLRATSAIQWKIGYEKPVTTQLVAEDLGTVVAR